MNLLDVIIIVKICSTFAISLVYLYLYLQYSEKYMGFWSFSWLLFALRLVLDLARFNGYDALPFLLINQFSSVLSVVFLMLGTYAFACKQINKWWVYMAIFATLLSDIAFAFKYSIFIAALPTATYFGVVNIWTGMMFFKFWEIKGLGKTITGGALILLGILNLSYPFNAATSTNFTMYVFIIGTILELVIILGTLAVYFQRIRTDLSESEQKFRLLADNAKDIIYRYNYFPEGHFDYVSPSITAVTGFLPEEFYSNPATIFKILNNDDHILYKHFIDEPFNFNSPLSFRIISKDGKEIWAEQHFVAIYDGDRKLKSIEGIVRDITERKTMEYEMAKLDRLNLIGEMAAGIGHEIRNPMQVVRGFLQILSEKELLDKYADYFSIMISELDRANGIISEYLSMAKNKAIDLKYHNLNTIVKAVVPLLQAEAIMSDKVVKIELEDIPQILLDEKEIRQLLINFAKNALEAMEKGGCLTIKTAVKDNRVVLSIKDEGRGIDPQVADKIGTPFFTTKESGVGLGLAICYSIAKRHHAKITYQTNDMGTVFDVSFEE